MKREGSKRNNEIREMKKKGFDYIGTIDNFEIPKWWECGWRRVSCGKDECKLCGRINQDRLLHIMKGEDPESMENVLADVGNSFKDALLMIKQDAAEKGIDITNIKEQELDELPEPDEFQLYNELAEWHGSISTIFTTATLMGSAWFYTEAAADLEWYSNMLLSKTYRQLCNRWELDRGDQYGHIDYKYTKYVLNECIRILKKALSDLSSFNLSQGKEFSAILQKLMTFEKSIVRI